MTADVAFILLAAASLVRAEGPEGTSREIFDGGAEHSRPAGTANACARTALELIAADRGRLSREDAVCRPDAPAGSAAARAISLQGLDAAGQPPPRARASRLAEFARKAPAFRAQLRVFYARVSEAEKNDAPPPPGWAWRSALVAASGDAVMASRLIAYCGSSEVDNEPLREPRSAAQARRAYEITRNALMEKISALQKRVQNVPSSASTDSADLETARAQLANMRPQDHLTSEEDICLAAGKAFFSLKALDAGVEPPPEPKSPRAPLGLFGSPAARAYAAARAACELSGTTAPDLARRMAANAAWAERRMLVGDEVRRAGSVRAAMSRRYENARRRAPGAPAEPEEDFIDRELRRDGERPRGTQDWIDRARLDAMFLLGNPDGTGAPIPTGWSAARHAAARYALDALDTENKAAAAAEEAGARFAASACAAPQEAGP